MQVQSFSGICYDHCPRYYRNGNQVPASGTAAQTQADAQNIAVDGSPDAFVSIVLSRAFAQPVLPSQTIFICNTLRMPVLALTRIRNPSCFTKVQSHSCMHSFILSFMHSFIHPFIHSFIHSGHAFSFPRVRYLQSADHGTFALECLLLRYGSYHYCIIDKQQAHMLTGEHTDGAC